MTDDLVKRPRTEMWDHEYKIQKEAADRIEKLEAANLKQSCIKVDDQMRIDALEGLLRFLLKNDQINPVSTNVVQSMLSEGDDNE